MPLMDLDRVRTALRAGRFEWRRHVLVRLAQRDIRQTDVLEVLDAGEVIEDYPRDRPFPSALFFGVIRGMALHVVAAHDPEEDRAYIVTAYEPDLEQFEEDFRTRRRRR